MLDLLSIRDLDRISQFEREGDIDLGNLFSFPFQTIESILPLEDGRLLPLNDNNYPLSAGRNPDEPNDTEAIIIRLDALLNLPPIRQMPGTGGLRSWSRSAQRYPSRVPWELSCCGVHGPLRVRATRRDRKIYRPNALSQKPLERSRSRSASSLFARSLSRSSSFDNLSRSLRASVAVLSAVSRKSSTRLIFCR